MFGRSSAVVQKLEPIIERPRPRLIVNNEPRFSEYRKLANDLGLRSVVIIREEILQAMAENNIQQYDYEEVHRYLKAKASELGKRWIWRPLRERDSTEWSVAGRDGHHGSYYGNRGGYQPYDKAVPLQVLRNVKVIQDRVPEALFWVSDYLAPNPDPFIAATALGVGQIIFGVWDEPGFFQNK